MPALLSMQETSTSGASADRLGFSPMWASYILTNFNQTGNSAHAPNLMLTKDPRDQTRSTSDYCCCFRVMTKDTTWGTVFAVNHINRHSFMTLRGCHAS